MHFVEGGVLCSGRGEGIRRVSSFQRVLCLREGTISHTGKNDSRTIQGKEERWEQSICGNTEEEETVCPVQLSYYAPACMQSSHFTDEKVEV